MLALFDFFINVNMVLKLIVKYMVIASILEALTLPVYAQKDIYSFGPWHFTSMNGTLLLEGFYKTQNNELVGLYDTEKATGFKGKANLVTNSYIWNPKFMKIFTELEYSPNAYQKNYIVTPDQSESVNAEKVNLHTTFLDGTFIPVNFFGTYVHSFTNRDLTADVELFSKVYGGGIGINNPILPLNITYLNSDWEQTELRTNHEYFYKTQMVSLTANNEMNDMIKNNINISYEDARNRYSTLDTIKNYITNGTVNSHFIMIPKSETHLNTYLSYNRITGYQDLLRYQAIANFRTKLPEQFRFSSSFQYNNQSIDTHTTISQNLQARLEHQLYLSLKSYGFGQLSNVRNTSFRETRNFMGLGFNYEKFIPTGKVYLNCEARYEIANHEGYPSPLVVLREDYELSSASVTIIRYPYVRLNSISVRNGDGTIIYKENIDYILTQKGNYTQISRIAGGLIADGGKVYIDYECELQSSYKYGLLGNMAELRFNLLNNFLDIYAKYTGNKYNNVDTSAFTVLHTLDRYVAGLQLNHEGFTLGCELENYNTNILPYDSYRIFLRYNNLLFNSLIVTFDGNFQYVGFKQDKKIQRVEDFNMNLNYKVNSWSNATFAAYFRNQDDPGTNLKLLIIRGGYELRFMNTKFTIGLEMFNRSINNFGNNYRGLFIRAERMF